MPEIIVQIVPKNILESLGERKLEYILDKILEGKILLLEEALTPEEQLKLIEATMKKIGNDKFKGIELAFYPENPQRISFLDRLLKRKKEQKVMLVGPADLIKEIRMKNDIIETIIKLEE